jgi:tetratricopeptide (TPR) repeat protein
MAISHIVNAIALNDHIPEFHGNLGGVYLLQGKLAEALACHQRALVLKPDYFEARSNLGFVLQQQGSLAGPCTGVDAGEAFTGAALAAGSLATDLTVVFVLVATGFVLAFDGAASGLTAAGLLADGAFDVPGPASEAEVGLAFALAVVLGVFATCPSLSRSCRLLPRSPLNEETSSAADCGFSKEILQVTYVLRLSAAVQVLPQRQDRKDLPSKSLRRRCLSRAACRHAGGKARSVVHRFRNDRDQ